ncbi:MAG: hypothetical protein RDA78_11940 [Roseibium sp.]|uniref:hypothetical protein n=1 Tax=Roseibium sp. TaxID=1936156 RepID=UPI003D9C06CB
MISTVKKTLLLLVSVSILFAGAALPYGTDAEAASCERRSAVEHLNDSDLVFYGYPIRGAGGARDDMDRVLEFKVLRAFKGVESDTVSIVYVNDDGGSAGWPFRDREATLVFAYYWPPDTKAYGVARVHFCSMLPYHKGYNKPEYWDVLTGMTP